MEKLFSQNLERILLSNNLEKPKKIAVALSGGCDSMCLVLLAKNWCKKTENSSVELIALTVDHSLRKESANEALEVKNFMDSAGISHKIITYNGEIPESNIEAIAREYRYNLLLDYCKNNNINYLLVGHNLNEKTETFLLNLTRGSGIYGLAGMKEFTTKNDVNIIRPMMNFTKEEIKNYLILNNQKWVEDPSNQDEKYKRVQIRKLKEIFSDLGLDEQRMLKTIDNLNRVRDVVEFYTSEALKNVLKKDNGLDVIAKENFENLPEEIQLRCLAEIILTIGKKQYSPRLENLELLKNNILNNFENPKTMTLGNCKFEKYKINLIKVLKEK